MTKPVLSDRQKLMAIGTWVATRGLVVALAYALLKFGTVVVRYV